MTWREYFKDSDLTRVPQEFLNKEIIVDDCLQIISMMSFTIKELLDKTKWQVGKPTEDGEYVCTVKIYPCSENSEFVQHPFFQDNLLYIKDGEITNCCIGEKFEIIRWYKIEPYRKSNDDIR